jgi:multidrug efflux pump subunit AcrB
VILAGFLLTVIMIITRPAPKKAEILRLAPLVKTEILKSADIQMIINGFGTVKPKVEVQIVPQVSGRVVSINPQFRAGDDIGIELSHEDFNVLLAATEKLKTILRGYTGVSDIADSFEQGKMELKLALNQKGRMSGLTLAELARQVRQGFYGHEVQRIQRGRDDIRVMVRYPKQQRKSLADIENVHIRLPNGTEIPFRTVAQVEYGYGFATIDRVDRRRVVTVTGDVDESTASASEINGDIRLNVLPKLMAEFPGLLYRYAGAQREQSETFQSLKNSFYIALLAIYVILAIEFTSYIQPLIVMSAIPFGLTGAILGHLLFGYNLSMLSVFGIIAMMGVVVNDSLIIIDLMNRRRKNGADLAQVVQDSATRRFRPIMLTTVTTSLALMPMVLERSLQARFLIPMAISLAFGVIFSAMITLFIVPSLYMVIEDVKNLFVKQKIS